MKVCCTHCNGTGKAELSASMSEALDAIKKLGKAKHSEIRKACKSQAENHITATYQLVKRLKDLGLIRQVGNERPMRFQAV